MRKHYTKPYIEQALIELLKQYPLNKITISDLVNKAGVSRASFYRNYLGLNQVIEEYIDKILNKEIPVTKNKSTNMKQSICAILTHFYQHREILKILYNNNLLAKMQKTIYQKTFEEIIKLNVFNNKYQPYFFAGATAGFIEGWIINNFQETPEQMTELFTKSLHGYMEVS